MPNEADLKVQFDKVAKVVDSSEHGSGIWFMVQLAAMGFLLPSAGNKLLLMKEKFGSNIDLGFPVPNQIALSKLLQTGINPANLERELRVAWNLEKDEPTPDIAQDILQKINGEIDKGKKIGSKKTGFNDWAKLIFAEVLNCPMIAEIKKGEDYLIYNDKFLDWNSELVHSWLDSNEIPDCPLADESFPWLFNNILPAAGLLGEKPADLMNPYHALGKFLNMFRNSTAELKTLLENQIPNHFQHKARLITLLCRKVQECASAVPLASEHDLLAKDWSEYRETNFSGRLSGWISNFTNRLTDYEKHLHDEVIDKKTEEKRMGGHKKIFEEIDKIDWESLFPQVQGMNFVALKELRPKLAQMLDEKSQTLGKTIFEYNKYLKEFREFLMKWSNEGIPQSHVESDLQNSLRQNKLLKKPKKGEEKVETENKILGFWSTAMVPAALENYPRFLYEAAKNPEKEISGAREQLLSFSLAGQSLIDEVLKHNKTSNDGENWLDNKRNYRRFLENLKNLALRAKNKDFIWRFFEKHILTPEGLNNELWINKSTKMRFFVSGYERYEYEELPVHSIDYASFVQLFGNYFGLTNTKDKAHFTDFFNLDGAESNSDNGELLKMYWGLQLRSLQQGVILPNTISCWDTLRQSSLKSLIFDEELPKTGVIELAMFRRFVASGIGSQIRAKLSLLSRSDFINRTVVQITNGGQSLLQYVPREWGDFLTVEITADKGAKRRRQKNACRSPLEKLQRRLKRTQNNIQKLSRTNTDYAVLEQRIRVIEQKIRQYENEEKWGFSVEARQYLEDLGLYQKTNEEIAQNIWSIFMKQDNAVQKKMTRILAEIPHSWNAVLKTKMPIQNMEPVKSGYFLEKSQEKSVYNFCTKKSDYLYAFPVQTSATQKQFLERFLWGDRDGVLTEKITGPSVILETVKEIRWKNGDLQLDEYGKLPDGETTMYIAIPFQFTKPKGDKNGEIVEGKRILGDTDIEITNSAGKAQKQNRTEKHLLGIDLGEYGFGYAVFNPLKKKFIDTGFVEIPLLLQMREAAKSWKDTQSSGIFSRPTTHLAKIRESAAGQVRNQIHRLALKYDAIPIYEDSVDGFESGGARVSKLYKTLKTADVIGGNSNDADKAVRKHFWGIENAQIGAIIGAAKTSQTCRVCGRCATSEVNSIKNENVNVVNGAIESTDIGCKLANGTYNKKDVEKAVKNAQRFESAEEKLNRESGRRHRGTVEKFECQICKANTNYEPVDCDAQAAKNIALKYYFKITAPEEARSNPEFLTEGNFSSLRYFLEKSKQPEWREL